MAKQTFELHPIGVVESRLRGLDEAPRQPDEGAPPADLVLEPEFEVALDGLKPGDHVIVLTWLDQADRGVLRVHPRDEQTNPMRGVFSTRSSDRPNPVGVHNTEIVAVSGNRVSVSALEAIDGTPVLDIKPRLGRAARES